jgi:hypothetical protein
MAETMSEPTREELLTLALGVLPEPPETVDVLSEDGGCFPITINGRDGDLLIAYGPRSQMRHDLHLLARVFYAERGRYEVEFEVIESFFHSSHEALVHLAVSGVRHRKARRASPRMPVSASATASVKYCRTLPRDTMLEVRVVDVSATGCAFVTQKELTAGDLMVVEFALADRTIRMESRVVRMDPAPYGRYRAGCEITEMSDGDRKAVSALAAVASDGGSEEQRNPEVVAAMAEGRASLTALSTRLGTTADD